MLDHCWPNGDAAVSSALQRAQEHLRWGLKAAAEPDALLLLAKVLIDHLSMRNDFAAVERLLALMQGSVAAALPRWQAAWWRLAAQNLEYLGRSEQARSAAQQLQQLAARLHDPELSFAAATEDMRLALHMDDQPRAERAFRAIERCRAAVRPALLPHGLKVQTALLLRRGGFEAALDRCALMLAICDDHAVPERDRAGYIEQQAHALTGLRRFDEAVAVLQGLRPTQAGGQAEVLEAIIAMAQAVRALDAAAPEVASLALQAVRQAAAIDLYRFLMSFPVWASRIAALALDAQVETEFITRVVRLRGLPPPQPGRADWPWALRIQVLGGLRVWSEGAPLRHEGGKAPRKPMELLGLLVAHPGGLDNETLIDTLWPSLEADAPKASLEMAIARLRKWLGVPAAVRVAEARVMLNPQCVWTDVAALEVALKSGDAAAALALHGGDLLAPERLSGPLLAARERCQAMLVAAVLQQVAALAVADQTQQHPQHQHPLARALLARGLAAIPDSKALRSALAELP